MKSRTRNLIIFLLLIVIIIATCLYALHIANKKWIKYSSKPVLGNKETGTLFDVDVKIMPDGKYRMYVSSRKNASISVSESLDGIHWGDISVVFSNDGKTTWDKIINRCSVVKIGDEYKMWYTGQTEKASMIGLASSQDGMFFTKVQDMPVLTPDKNYEQSNVMNPSVLYDENEKTYKMWYSAGEQYEPDIICYATSRNGIEWNKYTDNPVMKPNDNKSRLDSYKLGGCDVHKLIDGTYLMFYIGYTDINTARIFYATSSDGLNWERPEDNMIIEPSIGAFDSEATYKPSAVYNKETGKWMLWYNGRTGDREYIGLAYCNDDEFNNKYKE